MPEPTNFEIAKNVMQTLHNRIKRRSDEEHAIKILSSVVQQLQRKYDFLKYIKIVDNRYHDEFNIVHIDKEINSVQTDQFYAAINDLMKETIIQLKRVADYFFIREYKQSLGVKDESKLKSKGINLDVMQSDYILKRQNLYVIKNDDLFEHVIAALLRILNKFYPSHKSSMLMNTMLSHLSKRYDFLKFITLTELDDKKGVYEIIIYPDINKVWSLKLCESIQSLIEQTRKQIEWNQPIPFISMFKQIIGRDQTDLLERLGIDFQRLKQISNDENQKEITKKTLYALFLVISRHTAESYAVALLDRVIQLVQNDYPELKAISIDSSKYVKGFDAISIDDTINSINAKDFGHMLREIIARISQNLPTSEKLRFIDLIKKNLDEKTLATFEKIGLNLHMIELKLKNF
jgi:citrate lyase gamma subunit